MQQRKRLIRRKENTNETLYNITCNIALPERTTCSVNAWQTGSDKLLARTGQNPEIVLYETYPYCVRRMKFRLAPDTVNDILRREFNIRRCVTKDQVEAEVFSCFEFDIHLDYDEIMYFKYEFFH